MTNTACEDKKNEDRQDKTSTTDKIKELNLGVWTLRLAAGSDPRKYWSKFQNFIPLVCRLAADIFRVSPYYLTVYLICRFTYDGLEDFFLLGTSESLLKILETGIRDGTFNSWEIIYTIVSRLILTILFTSLNWYSEKVHIILHDKVTRHFKLLLMKDNLQIDLATSKDPGSRPQTNATEAWDALKGIIYVISAVLRSSSQIVFIMRISRSNGGSQGAFWMNILSLFHPVLSTYLSEDLWEQVCYGYISNPVYQRIVGLEKFANGTLRQEVISGGLSGWITEEYLRAHEQLGDLSTMHPYGQFAHTMTLLKNICLETLRFAPLVFFAINAAMHPDKFSLSSVAIMQQSSTHLRSSLSYGLFRFRSLCRSLNSLDSLYCVEKVCGPISKGIIPYPDPLQTEMSDGMSFELSNVAFSYPGSQSKEAALKNVSLNIKAGQLVIIVGANGSGKSTLVRLLSRLYDPTSGTIFIDGRPCIEYVVSDLHEATTLLSQDSQLYPLSLGENIGLGYSLKYQDADMISQAAKDGGADELISKLKEGMETVLEPQLDVFQINLNEKTHVLYQEMKSLRTEIDISGGERQKVACSRAFMRFKSGKIKFVAVDEPSSALDAVAEFQLFQNLIKARSGKTMVFVTHRFGHLTRYADHIICMKDGSIYEMGTHDALIKLQGEYANLYQIQASAFA